jgi:hypothetical protein
MKRHLATILGAVALFSAWSALADTFVMVCDKAACVRERCDDWHEDCSPAGYFKHTKIGNFAAPMSHQVCNEFGDCHYALPSYPSVNQTPNPIVPPTISTP